MPSEFQLIDAFVRASGVAGRAPAGPGDDAALLPRSQRPLCLTVDALVEGVHFRRSTSTLGDVGHKALAVNLSDLAAMGARPRWCLVALGLPPGFGLAEARQLGRGLGELARREGMVLLGGNVTRAPGLSLTLTAGGDAPRRPLLRSGARVGDEVWVSGTLGDARLGLLLLEHRAGAPGRRLADHPRAARAAVARQRRPTARLGLGALLAGVASACIDVSDGLHQDAGHLAAASEVRLRLALERLPLSWALREALPDAEAAGRFAASGGEDYELLFTARARAREGVLRAAAQAGVPVTAVGIVERGSGVRLEDRRRRTVRGLSGFDHLRWRG